MWTGVYLSGRVNFFKHVSRSPVHSVHRTAQSTLHVMLLSYYNYRHCVFHERQRDICRRRAYSQGFSKAKMLILYKPLLAVLGVSEPGALFNLQCSLH